MSSMAEALGRALARAVALEGTVEAVLVRALLIVGAVALAWLAYRLATHVIDRLLAPLEGAPDYSAKVRRARTLSPLMKSAAR
ncbi:MAG: hypothetical protein HY726_16620 [Candidatus Rokubacteria bacterium]|nr:hypothetical protein [Candidatus Rokubacteria bacterium]